MSEGLGENRASSCERATDADAPESGFGVAVLAGVHPLVGPVPALQAAGVPLERLPVAQPLADRLLLALGLGAAPLHLALHQLQLLLHLLPRVLVVRVVLLDL